MTRLFRFRLLFLFLLSASFLHAQTWRWELLKPQGNHLASFFSPQFSPVVFGCGKKGTLIRSDNLGVTWYRYSVPMPQLGKPDLRAGFFVDANNGYICGTMNCVLKTTDAGDSWNTLTTPSLPATQWNDIFFISSDTGLVVGDNGIVLRTTDGGATWVTVNSGVTTDLRQITFNDHQTGFIDADTKLLKTTDGGVTWSTQYTFPVSTSGIAFTHSDTVYARYYQSSLTRIRRSADGGITWQTVTSYSSNSGGPFCFINDSTGIEVRNNSAYRTTDRGVTWALVLNSSYSIPAMDVINPFCIVGGGYSGEIVFSPDRGATWSVRSTGSTSTVYSCVSINSAGQGFAVSQTHTMRTNDGGLSWSISATPPCSGLGDIQHIGNDTILAVSNCGFYRSPDVGISWTQPATGGVNVSLKGVGFLNADTGMMVSYNGLSAYSVHRSFDGGTTWDTVYTTTTYNLYDVAMISASVAVAGSQGKILRTTNGGSTWTVSYNSGTLPFACIQAFGDTVYAQHSGRILRSIDGGLTWITLTTGLSSYVRMDFRSARNGMISAGGMIGYTPGAYVASTNDAGNTWHIYPDDMGNVPMGFSASDTSLILLSLDNSGLLSWESDTTQLQSSFSADHDNVCLGDTIYFQNHGSTTGINYSWYIDGIYQANTYHFYWPTSAYGVHRVGMYAVAGSDSSYHEALVRIDTLPSPGFSYTVNEYTVTFSDQSNSLNSWKWSFGDSVFSALTNPIHTYGAVGVFPVQLIISNACGTDSLVTDVSILGNFNGYTYRSTYDMPLAWTRPFTRVEACYDGGILALTSPTNSASCELIKFDGEGNLHWRDEQRIPNVGRILYDDIAVTEDRHYLAAGSTMNGGGIFTKIDSADRIVWSKHFASFRPKSIDARGAFIYSAGTALPSPQPGVALLDSAGNLLWTKEFTTTYAVTTAELCVLSDGTFVAVFTDGGNGTFLVVRVDLNGTVLWARNYITPTHINYVHDLFADSSGHVYLGGLGMLTNQSPATGSYNFICCINAFTNSNDWERNYLLSSNYNSPSFADEMHLRPGLNGEILMVLRTSANIIGYSMKHYLLLLDSAGIPVSAALDNGYIEALTAMPDSGYVLVGEGVNQPVGGNIYPLVKRVDAAAQPSCLGQYAGCVAAPISIPYLIPAAVPLDVPVVPSPDTAARYNRASIPRETYCWCAAPIVATVSGDTTICAGDTVTLSVTGGTAYQWWPDTSLSSDTNAMVSAFPVVTTTYDVHITSTIRCWVDEQVTVIVDAPSPVISANGNVLSSNYPAGNQWYLNGNPIPGATQQQLTATSPGNYTVEVVTANGCTGMSTPVTISGIVSSANGEVHIFPVPATDRVEVNLPASQEYVITLYDFSGRKVRQWTGAGDAFTLRLGELPSANYEIIIVTDQGVFRKTLPVQQ